MKAFADDKFNEAKMTIFLFERVTENTVGKGENAGYPASSSGLIVKSLYCVVKSYKPQFLP